MDVAGRDSVWHGQYGVKHKIRLEGTCWQSLVRYPPHGRDDGKGSLRSPASSPNPECGSGPGWGGEDRTTCPRGGWQGRVPA